MTRDRRRPRPRPVGWIRRVLLGRGRAWTAGITGGLGTVLTTVAAYVHNAQLQLVTLALIGVLAAMSVLLSTAGSRAGAEQPARRQPTDREPARSRRGRGAGTDAPDTTAVHPGPVGPPPRVDPTAVVGPSPVGWPLVDPVKAPVVKDSDSVPTLPPQQSAFRGRRRELEELLGQHDRARIRADGAGAAGTPPAGPVLLLLHGRPGVGKSALAQELAHRLAPHYPDGQLYANLGSAGTDRPAEDVLKGLLAALGRSHVAATERANLFRSLTIGRRLLIVLDAARDANQVGTILPADPNCAVIVTSRRNLGPSLVARSFAVEVPEAVEARQILHAYAHTDESTAPAAAVKIVELCGALPIALRAAGERADATVGGLAEVSRGLDAPISRLAFLTYEGRSAQERISGEYDLLMDREQRAFRMLSLVRSASFVPWVLTPLLSVETEEAETLVGQLSAAQLLDVAEGSGSDGLNRYSFHPLFRLVAEQKLREHEDELHRQGRPSDREAAVDRLDSAYLWVAEQVLAELGELPPVRPGPQAVRRWDHLPPQSPWPRRIAANPHRWVRAEHANLVRVVHAAYRAERWAVCWRVAVWLGGCLPHDVDVKSGLGCFNCAIRAAEADDSLLGRVRVLLAKGAFWVALENYRGAFATLAEARDTLTGARALAQQGGALPGPDPAATIRDLAASVERVNAEALVQMAAYRQASEAVITAEKYALEAGGTDRLRLIGLLRAEVDGATDHERWKDTRLFDDALPLAGQGDGNAFRAFLGAAEAARRRLDWGTAEENLRGAMRVYEGDARRTASVQFRLARLWWHRGRAAGSDAERVGHAGRAVTFAAETMRTFDRMHNQFGVLRARSLLIRALVAADRTPQAAEELAAAQRDLSDLLGADPDERMPLLPRVRRAHGELLLATNQPVAARQSLQDAVNGFMRHDDWWSRADTSLLLGRALRKMRRCTAAYVPLFWAAKEFERAGDRVSQATALTEIARTATAMGMPGTAAEFQRYARDVFTPDGPPHPPASTD